MAHHVHSLYSNVMWENRESGENGLPELRISVMDHYCFLPFWVNTKQDCRHPASGHCDGKIFKFCAFLKKLKLNWLIVVAFVRHRQEFFLSVLCRTHKTQEVREIYCHYNWLGNGKHTNCCLGEGHDVKNTYSLILTCCNLHSSLPVIAEIFWRLYVVVLLWGSW